MIWILPDLSLSATDRVAGHFCFMFCLNFSHENSTCRIISDAPLQKHEKTTLKRLNKDKKKFSLKLTSFTLLII